MQKSWVAFVFSLLFLPAMGQESDLSTKAKSFTPNKDVRVQLRVLRSNADIVHGKYTQSFLHKKHLVGEFNLGKRHGTWESYRLDGSLRLRGYYENGERHGTWTYHSAKGNILATWHYNQGELEDVLRSHYNNNSNNVAMEIAFPEEHKPSQAILYFENNRAGAYFEWKYKDTLTAQSSQWYYTNQQLAFFENRLNGQLHGTVSTYHPNGVVWENFSYKNNVLIDVVDMRSNTGQPHDFGDFALGNGTLLRYTANSTLFSRSKYKEGSLIDSVLFYSNGQETGRGFYKNNKPHGHWILRNKAYLAKWQAWLDADADTARVRTLKSQSKREYNEGSYRGNHKHGTWISTNPYEEKLAEYSFQKGLYEGEYTIFYPSGGAAKNKGLFHCGCRIGTWQTLNIFNQVSFQKNYKNLVACENDIYEYPQTNWHWIPNPRIVREVNQSFFTNYIHTNNVGYFLPDLPGAGALAKIPGDLHNDFLSHIPKNMPEGTLKPEFFFPQFPGGITNEINFFENNPELLDEAWRMQISGSILIRFKVDVLGTLSEFKIIRSVGFGLDDKAVQYLREMPAWNPAIYMGLPTDCYVLKRIDFNIPDAP